MRRSNCYRKECNRIRSELSLFLSRRRAPNFEGHSFCSEDCVRAYAEESLTERWHVLQREKGRKALRPRLGSILLQTAAVSREQLEKAVALQRQKGEGRLGDWLTRLGFVSEHQVTMALSKQYGLPVIQLKETDAPSDVTKLVPAKIARSLHFLPVGYDDRQDAVRVAIALPRGFTCHEALRRMIGKGLVTFIGDESCIRTLLDRWYNPDAERNAEETVFRGLDDLIAIVRATLKRACAGRAANIRMELLGDYLWARIDCEGGSVHQLYRQEPAPVKAPQPFRGPLMACSPSAAY